MFVHHRGREPVSLVERFLKNSNVVFDLANFVLRDRDSFPALRQQKFLQSKPKRWLDLFDCQQARHIAQGYVHSRLLLSREMSRGSLRSMFAPLDQGLGDVGNGMSQRET